MSGVEKIQNVFSDAHTHHRAVLMPYFTLGFPTPSQSVDIVEAIARAGAGVIELGIPFSDPLADGPTIQQSTQAALDQGVTLPDCIEMVRQLRSRDVSLPLLIMGYYNPIFNYGLEKFTQDAQAAGVDGLIVPDLPPEESGELEACCKEVGMALIYLVAPTSTPDRQRMITNRTTGFTYLVSVRGVTGTRANLADDLADFLASVRQVTTKPIAVGFGISNAQQARAVAQIADGVIVGSALIRVVSQAVDPVTTAAAFVKSLADAIDP